MPLVNLLLRYIANGELWFALGIYAIALTLVDAAGLLDRRPLGARAAGFTLVLACAFGALCGTPLPLLLWMPLALSAAFHALLGFHSPSLRLRRTGAALFTVAAGIALAHEVPFQIGPDAPSGPPPRALVVLGDSLSAGGYGEARTWTRILEEEDGLDVRDLSRDGQTVASALEGARAFFDDSPGPPDAAVVLIELGGNDVLGESPLALYESSLERLLTLCRGEPPRPRTVVMLEIPGVPGRWGFAAAQRRLAARHEVVLVPKRVLANIVFARGSTSGDALHLTQRGHDRFAAAMRPWLGLGLRADRPPDGS